MKEIKFFLPLNIYQIYGLPPLAKRLSPLAIRHSLFRHSPNVFRRPPFAVSPKCNGRQKNQNKNNVFFQYINITQINQIKCCLQF